MASPITRPDFHVKLNASQAQTCIGQHFCFAPTILFAQTTQIPPYLPFHHPQNMCCKPFPNANIGNKGGFSPHRRKPKGTKKQTAGSFPSQRHLFPAGFMINQLSCGRQQQLERRLRFTVPGEVKVVQKTFWNLCVHALHTVCLSELLLNWEKSLKPQTKLNGS